MELCPGGGEPAPCSGGMSDGYPCQETSFVSVVRASEMDGGSISDSWGWEHQRRAFAIVGHTKGTSFLDVTDACEPKYLGMMPQSASESKIWHDIKVRKDHAFVCSEAKKHGMQVFDLKRLLDMDPASASANLDADKHYDKFGACHNMIAHAQGPYVSAVGTDTCSRGMHIIDISDPKDPQQVGCWSEAGYVHDVHCVTYQGPDDEHAGKEICITSNGGGHTISVVDFTDKENPIELARPKYPQAAYSHQGWISPDHRFYYHGDELDEGMLVDQTRTIIWDIQDLDEPVIIDDYLNPNSKAIGHNMYIVKGQSIMYQANYQDGVRILDISNSADGQLVEVGYFDESPNNSGHGWAGAWNVYPFFDHGAFMISGGKVMVLATTNLTPAGR
ncbi:MAG: choice-of-anchor B family protein [Myxococcales bacterium FL481]|nr:MAG: choice-of-anchor B family protein [Myxococcales bacterium FL481]